MSNPTNRKFLVVNKEDLEKYFSEEIPLGEGKTFQPEGVQFLFLRENDKAGDAEVHENITDVFIAGDGNEILFIIGGELDETAWTKAEGELRAKGIKDGVRVNLKPGETLCVPAGTPHQRLPNGLVSMQVFKIPAK